MKRVACCCIACAAVLSWTAAGADVLQGVVRDTDGNPVTQDVFNIYMLDGSRLVHDHNTSTTGRYQYQLPAGRYDVICDPVIGSRLAPHETLGVLVSGVTILNWTLEPAARVLGRVHGPDGAPVDSAVLDFDRIDDGTRQPSLGHVTSPFGTFVVSIEPGDYRVTVNPPPEVDLAPARLAHVSLPTSDTLDFVLVAAMHLDGVVSAPAGEPVAGARLEFDRVDTGERIPASRHFSGADGAFRAGVAPGIYKVLIEPPRGSHLAAARSRAVDLTHDQALGITLPAGMLVSGIVRSRDGQPLALANWSAWDETTQLSVPTTQDKTDYDGQYSFAVPAGIYRFMLYPPAGSMLDTLVFRHVRIARDTVMDVSYRGGPFSAPLALAPLGNPAHGRADVRFVLPSDGLAKVEIFDVTGHRVAILADGMLTAGVQTLHWDGRRLGREQARTGVYFVRAVHAGRTAVTRFILLP